MIIFSFKLLVSGIDFWIIYTEHEMKQPPESVNWRNVRLLHMSIGDVMVRLALAATGTVTNGSPSSCPAVVC